MAGDGYDATTTWARCTTRREPSAPRDMWRRGYHRPWHRRRGDRHRRGPEPEFDGRLVNGPDLSFDSQRQRTRYVDGYGHGTHMASIIAGARPAAPARTSRANADYFVGMAPGARMLNVKVGASNGVTDVSQVIAAIDWVVQHRNTDGLNVRVLNLSFGTDGTQDYVLDPLTYAVETRLVRRHRRRRLGRQRGLWHDELDNPAYDPFVIAVGAETLNGTLDPLDDLVTDFSNRGTRSVTRISSRQASRSSACACRGRSSI